MSQRIFRYAARAIKDELKTERYANVPSGENSPMTVYRHELKPVKFDGVSVLTKIKSSKRLFYDWTSLTRMIFATTLMTVLYIDSRSNIIFYILGLFWLYSARLFYVTGLISYNLDEDRFSLRITRSHFSFGKNKPFQLAIYGDLSDIKAFFFLYSLGTSVPKYTLHKPITKDLKDLPNEEEGEFYHIPFTGVSVSGMQYYRDSVKFDDKLFYTILQPLWIQLSLRGLLFIASEEDDNNRFILDTHLDNPNHAKSLNISANYIYTLEPDSQTGFYPRDSDFLLSAMISLCISLLLYLFFTQDCKCSRQISGFCFISSHLSISSFFSIITSF